MSFTKTEDIVINPRITDILEYIEAINDYYEDGGKKPNKIEKIQNHAKEYIGLDSKFYIDLYNSEPVVDIAYVVSYRQAIKNLSKLVYFSTLLLNDDGCLSAKDLFWIANKIFKYFYSLFHINPLLIVLYFAHLLIVLLGNPVSLEASLKLINTLIKLLFKSYCNIFVLLLLFLSVILIFFLLSSDIGLPI
jgi:hypothetical protein